MAEERIQRKLTTILAADVEGYSRLASADEEATLRTLKSYRETIDRLITRHEGRIFGQAGDSVLAEFGSAVEAVRCAMSIQEELRVRNAEFLEDRRMLFRIGINVGDVLVEGDNLFGDGVNIAARLEGIAEPGGICVSGSAFDQVKNKLSVGFENMGPQTVKNIPEPVSAFSVVAGPVSVAGATAMQAAMRRWPFWGIAATLVVIVAIVGGVAWWQPWVPDVEPASIDKMAYKLPDRPSIAVLPFTNMSGDKEQDYFADGITEDIITDLSKVSGLFVVARNSTFTYKGKAVKVRQIAEDLGVRYVLEGSVRRAGGQVRINAQLIDAVKGNHLWAERYDRELRDVFAVQTDVTQHVVRELAVTLKANEQERLFRKHTQNVEAYDTFLRARQAWQPPTKESILRAKSLFERVIELDRRFAGGYAGLSFVHSLGVRQGFSASPKKDIERALELARKAMAADDTFGWSYVALGSAYLMTGEHDKAIAAMQDAVRIQPSDADAYSYLGFYLNYAGQGEEAIGPLKKAMRLNPKMPSHRYMSFLGRAYFIAGRYEEAIATINQRYNAFARRGASPLAYLAAAYAATGRDEKARATMKLLLDKRRKMSLSTFGHLPIYKRAEDRERLAKLLRKAGMPE